LGIAPFCVRSRRVDNWTDQMDIQFSIANGLAQITLNRPAKRNALSLAMWRAIPAMIAEAAANEGLRLVILRGEGGVFSGGADIAEFPSLYASRETAMENQQTIQAAMSAVENCPIPTLAVIEGPCYGGGCGLALACDMRFAAETATFAITPGKLGLVYGLDDTRRLAAAVGPSRAKDILFTGRTLNAAEALSCGLIDRTAPASELMVLTDAYRQSLAAAAATTARGTKDMLKRLGGGQRHDDDATRAMFGEAFSGVDFKEGFAAFMERRPPRFR
jgi:enoyl-CoA hydratase/carnithine racemase